MMATLTGMLFCAGDQFLVGHLEATVTVDNPHGGFGGATLAPIPAGTPAHGAQTSGANEVAGLSC